MKPKVLILRTAGTNCDKETEFAFALAGAQTYLYHINHIKENARLCDYQIIAIPGGFSYGDDLGAGKILSLELLLWFKKELGEFIERGGLMIGICNGFQALVKTGILPDLDFQQKVTLTGNDSGRFEDRWTYLEVKSPKSKVKNIWLKDFPEIINFPVAHGEGKFYAEKAVLDAIEQNNQVALRYVDKGGDAAGYPFNPNGSLRSIAGIVDKTGRVFGLMPHPERFIFEHQWPYWKKKKLYPFGLKIFENGVKYFL
ncbi:MAG: phosphoribosylformylglycinamidine synthase I [Candidatus Omnitrophota bacterium]